jgi:hypothetical protein
MPINGGGYHELENCVIEVQITLVAGGAVVAVMYAGGNMLEDFAVARAERDLKFLQTQ